MDLIKLVEKEYLKEDKTPKFKPGDIIKVSSRISEGGKEKIQSFEGVVIRVRGGGINKTFTLRKISQGVGVEKTYLLNSPKIDKIRLIKEGKVRRAKLYYLRTKIGKSAKIKREEK